MTWRAVVTRCLINDARGPGPKAWTLYLAWADPVPDYEPTTVAVYSPVELPAGTYLTMTVEGDQPAPRLTWGGVDVSNQPITVTPPPEGGG